MKTCPRLVGDPAADLSAIQRSRSAGSDVNLLLQWSLTSFAPLSGSSLHEGKISALRRQDPEPMFSVSRSIIQMTSSEYIGNNSKIYFDVFARPQN